LKYKNQNLRVEAATRSAAQNTSSHPTFELARSSRGIEERVGNPAHSARHPTPKIKNTKRSPFEAKRNGAREGNVFPIIKKFPIATKKGLYCTWIRQSERPGAPLVAVWIDPSMSCFRTDSEGKQHNAEELAVAHEDNDGVAEMPPPPAVATRQKRKPALHAAAATLLWMFTAVAGQGQRLQGLPVSSAVRAEQ